MTYGYTETMNPAQFLELTKEVVQKGWTKNYFARNADQDPVPITHPYATCFCLVGALRRVSNVRMVEIPIEAQLALQRVVGRQSIPDFNDDPETTKEDVINAIEEAIRNVS